MINFFFAVSTAMKCFGCEEEGNMMKVSPNEEIVDA